MSVNKKELAVYLAVFVVCISVLFMLSALVNPSDFRYSLLKGFSLSLSLSLIVMAAGTVVGLHGRNTLSMVLRTFVFWTVFLFLLDFEAFPRVLSAEQASFMPPLFILEESLVLFVFATRSIARGELYYSGITAKDLSRAFFTLSIGIFLYVNASTMTFSFFFIPITVYLFVESFAAVMMNSRIDALSNLGRYFVKSGNLLSGMSVIVGLLLVAYEYPKPYYINEIILALILVVSVLIIVGISWRIYSTTSYKIRKISDEIFLKHKKSSTVFSDTSLDSVTDSVNEFRRRGNKEKLIVTLTMIMTTTGRSLDECNTIMRSLLSYKAPDPLVFKRFSTRARLENEIRVRDRIIKEIVREMKNFGAES